MSEHVYFITIGLVPLTVLLVFGMRYVSQVLQARARLAAEDDYRKLAETSAAAQAQTASALAALQPGLDEMRARLAAVEKILKDVG